MLKMTEEEILQDNKTVEQIVDGMNLFDDDLMSMVFDGNYRSYWTIAKDYSEAGRYYNSKCCWTARVPKSCCGR